MSQVLFTVKETAKMLGISPRTIYNRRSQGGFIACRRIGRRLLFHINDINDFIRNLPRG